MSEQWAFCDRCHRWFYGEQHLFNADDLRCPVCDASPSMVRVDTLDGPADTTISTP